MWIRGTATTPRKLLFSLLVHPTPHLCEQGEQLPLLLCSLIQSKGPAHSKRLCEPQSGPIRPAPYTSVFRPKIQHVTFCSILKPRVHFLGILGWKYCTAPHGAFLVHFRPFLFTFRVATLEAWNIFFYWFVVYGKCNDNHFPPYWIPWSFL